MHAKTKLGIMSTLLVFFLLFIGGCTTTYLDMKSWEGRSLNDLYFELGKPDEIESRGADTVHTWVSERTVDGKVKACRKSFTSRNYGDKKQVIIDTSYSGCLFFTLK